MFVCGIWLLSFKTVVTYMVYQEKVKFLTCRGSRKIICTAIQCANLNRKLDEIKRGNGTCILYKHCYENMVNNRTNMSLYDLNEGLHYNKHRQHCQLEQFKTLTAVPSSASKLSRCLILEFVHQLTCFTKFSQVLLLCSMLPCRCTNGDFYLALGSSRGLALLVWVGGSLLKRVLYFFSNEPSLCRKSLILHLSLCYMQHFAYSLGCYIIFM